MERVFEMYELKGISKQKDFIVEINAKFNIDGVRVGENVDSALEKFVEDLHIFTGYVTYGDEVVAVINNYLFTYIDDIL